MKLRTIAMSLGVLLCTVAGYADNNKTTHSRSVEAHRQAHARLANVNTKLDMSVINGKIGDEIAAREHKAVNPESMAMISDLLKEARKHLGKPYRHGSKGPNSFDCSGFSSYVYRQFGYSISPASKAQYFEGTKVDRKSLREGDLVFFNGRNMNNGVGHVGIVVSADNNTGEFKFIHASIKGVKISECEGYYAKRYIGARRIIE